MKKWLGLLLIIISCFFVGNSAIFSYAEENNDEVQISTLYPENTLYYQNLDNLKNIAINNNYIAYNQSNSSLLILNKTTKNLIEVDNLNYIHDFKFVSNNHLVVIDKTSIAAETWLWEIKYITINELDEISINTIPNILPSTIEHIDIYNNNNKILIGYIKSGSGANNSFELYEIELVNNTPSTPVLRDTYTSDLLNTTRNLVLTDSQLCAVFTNNDSQPILLSRSYGSDTITTNYIISNIQLLDYYSYNSNNYLVAFTLENLRLLPLNNLESNSTTLTELSISDIDIYDGQIYLAETHEKSITSYVISQDSNENIIFEKHAVLIASKNSSLGRFNEVNDMFIQGDTIYVADTKNNRIQIIKDNRATQINDLLVDTQPHAVQLDDKQNIYFVEKTSSTTSNIAKYSLNSENIYTRATNYSTYSSGNLGLISDTTITANNEVFILDYTNNKLLSLNAQTGIQPKLSFDFTLTQFSKIEYIRASNQLAVLNNNVIHLIDILKLNTNNNPILDALAISNCADITAGLNSVIALCDNQIKCINIVDGIMHTNTKILNQANFSQFTNINYNIATNEIFAFNSSSQSIVYFDYSIEDESLDFNNITASQPLTSTPLAITVINDAIIYDLPYNIGNQYTNITSCIGIELYNDTYYRVLFNNNNKLTIGFLNKYNAQISQHNTTAKINVITTNLKVPVYKYPTILKFNGQAIITNYISINTMLTISSNCFPITIDNKLFYIYENNGQIGYIFNADVILNDNSNITALHNNNATIKIIGEDQIYIYDEDKTTILGVLNNDARISVENYDKNNEYTLVHFKTDQLTTITGYVKTDYIEMDKMDNNKIVLIVIIIVSILILAVIIVSYIVIKRKKN